MNCPFCEPKQRVLRENDFAYVVLSNPRKLEGHFLVIPKRHVARPWEMNKEEIAAVMELVLFVQEKLEEKLGGGSNVRQNFMPFLPDSRTKVTHVHYHVWPRKLGDKMSQVVDIHDKTLFEDLSEDEHDRTAKLLD